MTIKNSKDLLEKINNCKNIVFMPDFKHSSVSFMKLFSKIYNDKNNYFDKKDLPDLIISNEMDFTYVKATMHERRIDLGYGEYYRIDNIQKIDDEDFIKRLTRSCEDGSEDYGDFYYMNLYIHGDNIAIPLIIAHSYDDDLLNGYILFNNIKCKYVSYHYYGYALKEFREKLVSKLNCLSCKYYFEILCPELETLSNLCELYNINHKLLSKLPEFKVDYIPSLYKIDQYKYNISDKLALGYGSKYQLLRMLGWHREEFNNHIQSTIKQNEYIEWLDFNYNGPEDKEIMNADFIKDKNIIKKWNELWPTNNDRNGLNWDAIGKTVYCYHLLEAKAKLDECGNPKEFGGGTQREKAQQAIYAFQDKYDIQRTDWTIGTDCYQIANRLVFLDFLKNNHIDAKLIYVLFINGYEFNTKDGKNLSVKDKQEWEGKFDQLFKKMNIKNTIVEKMINFCYIDSNPKNNFDNKK